MKGGWCSRSIGLFWCPYLKIREEKWEKGGEEETREVRRRGGREREKI